MFRKVSTITEVKRGLTFFLWDVPGDVGNRSTLKASGEDTREAKRLSRDLPKVIYHQVYNVYEEKQIRGKNIYEENTCTRKKRGKRIHEEKNVYEGKNV